MNAPTMINMNAPFHPKLSAIIPKTKSAMNSPRSYPQSPEKPVAEPTAKLGTTSIKFIPINN